MLDCCRLFVIQAIVFFIRVPGSPSGGADAGPILIGAVATLAVGEVLRLSSRKKT